MPNMTKLANLVNPEVMADMISATLPKKIKFSPIAKIDTTLVGRPGDTITVPKYAYIGDAEDVAEGVAMDTALLTTSTTTVKVKKAGKAVELTDESLLSGYGDPAGEATRQITMAIASKVDNDCLAALYTAPLTYNGSAGVIGYEGIVKADAIFGDESDDAKSKVIYIHPDQEQTLRLDANFMDKNKYGLDLVMNGAIGKIAGIEVKKSKKVEKDESGNWKNPIVILATEDPNEDPSADNFATEDAAITIYMKRDVAVETDRDILAKTTVTSADEHYGVALSNDSKVVIATFKA
jgi:N4-gp56 family major capsid protein